ncbi:universal stress protein [Leisingera sp. D0M16]|uniref:universal stress protein n=1 Tax=Leisingera coralii TaxID=3351347 RepID=UPI003BA0C85D
MSPASGKSRKCRLFQRVLVCLDRSPNSQRVLEKAVELAKLLEAPLTAVRMSSEPGNDFRAVDPVDWELAKRDELERLRELAVSANAPGDIHLEILTWPEILTVCRKADAQERALTVIGAGEHKEKGSQRFGGTSRDLIDSLPGSVFIVPAPLAGGRGNGPERRVLAPLDGSSEAEAALRIAAQFASKRDAELVLIHAIEEVAAPASGQARREEKALCERLMSHRERVAQNMLERVRRLIPGNGVRSRVLRARNPRQALAQSILEEQGELVVLSARGMGGDPELSVGSTADYLISHATTPVLLVRTKAGELPQRSAEAPPRRPGTVHDGT